MATTTPFTAAVTATYPPDDGVAAAARSNSVSGTYQHKAEFDLVLEGTGSQVVDFGSLLAAGAKVVQIEVDSVAPGGTAAPINVVINGGADTWEISQGGHLQHCSPAPTAAGITAMTINHTQDARVMVRLLG